MLPRIWEDGPRPFLRRDFSPAPEFGHDARPAFLHDAKFFHFGPGLQERTRVVVFRRRCDCLQEFRFGHGLLPGPFVFHGGLAGLHFGGPHFLGWRFVHGRGRRTRPGVFQFLNLCNALCNFLVQTGNFLASYFRRFRPAVFLAVSKPCLISGLRFLQVAQFPFLDFDFHFGQIVGREFGAGQFCKLVPTGANIPGLCHDDFRIGQIIQTVHDLVHFGVVHAGRNFAHADIITGVQLVDVAFHIAVVVFVRMHKESRCTLHGFHFLGRAAAHDGGIIFGAVFDALGLGYPLSFFGSSKQADGLGGNAVGGNERAVCIKPLFRPGIGDLGNIIQARANSGVLVLILHHYRHKISVEAPVLALKVKRPALVLCIPAEIAQGLEVFQIFVFNGHGLAFSLGSNKRKYAPGPAVILCNLFAGLAPETFRPHLRSVGKEVFGVLAGTGHDCGIYFHIVPGLFFYGLHAGHYNIGPFGETKFLHRPVLIFDFSGVFLMIQGGRHDQNMTIGNDGHGVLGILEDTTHSGTNFVLCSELVKINSFHDSKFLRF